MEREQPDLLLLNLMMPHMDGIEVLKAVRGREDLSDVPILVVTGSTDPATKQRAVDHGATDFLGKPIDPSELSLRVRNTLSASGRIFEPPAPAEDPPRHARPERRPVAAPGAPLVSRLTGDDLRSRAIVEAFVGRLRDKLTAMEESIAERDFTELIHLAHWLKGAAGTVGFDEFTEPAQALQYLARERKHEPLESAIEELWALADRIAVGPEAKG
jgi:CheY-like chemotaxis protein